MPTATASETAVVGGVTCVSAAARVNPTVRAAHIQGVPKVPCG